MPNFQDGRGHYFEKSKNDHISATVWPIVIRNSVHDACWPSDHADCQNFEILKIDISLQQFDRSSRNLAWWHSLTLLTLKTEDSVRPTIFYAVHGYTVQILFEWKFTQVYYTSKNYVQQFNFVKTIWKLVLAIGVTCVKWCNVVSDFFELTCGRPIRQGGVLSPYLFAVYIDTAVW